MKKILRGHLSGSVGQTPNSRLQLRSHHDPRVARSSPAPGLYTLSRESAGRSLSPSFPHPQNK